MLGPHEQRIVLSLAETMFPMEDPGSPFRAVDIVGAIHDFFRDSTPLPELGLKLSLWTLELSPPLWGHGFCRFTRMAPAARTAYLSQWEHCRQWTTRNVFFTLKAILMTLVYDQPVVAREICRAR